MKLSGIAGTGTGRLGSHVYATIGGIQIVRAYQPAVSNPATQAQTNQRARFKLTGQLAGAMSPVIAIRKKGLITSRSGFVKKNIDKVMTVDNVAQVSLENLQLTDGAIGLSGVVIDRSGSSVAVNLGDDASAVLSRVTYSLFKVSAENQLQFVASAVASIAGVNGDFPAVLPQTSGQIIVYAYGMRDNNAAATARFNDYNVVSGQDIARLAAERKLSAEDYSFTKTRGTMLQAGETESVVVPDGSARVYVTAMGNGTVSGGGVYVIGSSVTVTASPAAGMQFVGWRLNGSNSNLSTSASYTFTLSGQMDLVAVFIDPNAGSNAIAIQKDVTGDNNLGYTVSVTPSDATVYVPEGGSVQMSTSSTVEGGDTGQLQFDGWFFTPQGGSEALVSNNKSFTFSPSGPGTLKCTWHELA